MGSTMHVLISGGAGFVGSNLALAWKRDRAGDTITALDNLRRRGSELALARLKAGGVAFRHGDIRMASDLADAGKFDLLLECSAEPSVQAGYDGAPAYVVDTNLTGTINCLNAARQHGAAVIFLSTSRVYPIARLAALPLTPRGERLTLAPDARGPGWSAQGIAEDFPLDGARSLYGATKLASELIVEEYRAMYGLKAVIDRCGVIAGPWQMGKVDQGFVVLWAARHLYGGALAYIGYGGHGHQVRDVLHVDDLYDLVCIQAGDPAAYGAGVFNVGGGAAVSTSLAELTELCRLATGRQIDIESQSETRAADIPFYVSDHGKITNATGWRPRRDMKRIVADVTDWLAAHRTVLEPILGVS
jgi:CDP-paratose 2-epimerase